MPQVNPAILVWARETAGLSPSEAAQKLEINDARGVAATDRLAALEAGTAEPSRPLLTRMAKQYRRPLLTFYMSAPPRKGNRGEDFRNIPERQPGAEAAIDALVRDIRARQGMVRSVLEDDEDAEPLPFVGSIRMKDGVGAVLASIRQTLSLELTEFRAQGSPEAAFALLRSRVEAIGVFVLLIGNLGSHHSRFDAEAFRGFALADPLAPFIVINDQDAKSAWSFTLLHELAHIWLGVTGVSGPSFSAAIEKFCNDVAGAFLLPQHELAALDFDASSDLDRAAEAIDAFARERLLSRPMVAYRMLRTGRIDEAAWNALNERFRQQWRDSRDRQRTRDNQGQGGPDYYVVRRHRLGTALLRFVSRNMSEGTLTPTKAGRVLGVRPRNVRPLLSGAALSTGQAA